MPSVISRIRAAARAFVGTAARVRAARMYGTARPSRTGGGLGISSTSADAELGSSLTRLRNSSRQLIRDSAYAQRAQQVIVNNVIGNGVGLQAQVESTRANQNTRVNDAIEQAWAQWCAADQCHTGGALHFSDLERAALGEVFEAGEVFLRVHKRTFGRSTVPLAVELIEAERLADEWAQPLAAIAIQDGHELRLGVECDRYGRAVAYWIRERHAGDVRHTLQANPDRFERVPADEVFHLRLVRRWPQTRGVPWMHAVLRKIDDLDQYSQHEVTAARASAAYFATIETPEANNPLATDEEADGGQVMDIDPLTIQELAPGEKLSFHAPNRPNSAFDAFVRSLLREIAAGVGTGYESLSRDYSQSNYSSSRLALLDDRDGYRALQQWWVRSFRRPLHALWLQQAVLSRAVQAVPLDAYALDRARYEAAIFKCRGWSWVDPTKEVTAYKEAIKAGLTTLTDVIAQTANGLDFEDFIRTRQRELQLLADAGIEVDTTVGAQPMGLPVPGEQEEDPEEDEPPAATARVMALRKPA